MISKKLLSEVFNEKVLSYNVINKTEIIVQFVEHDEVINIHELAHKCKEWAYIKGYLLDSRVTISGSCFLQTSPCSDKEDINKTFVSINEPESVFKACEWIMENSK